MNAILSISFVILVTTTFGESQTTYSKFHHPKTFNLFDQARKHLQDLKETVGSAVVVGRSKIQAAKNDYANYARDISEKSKGSIVNKAKEYDKEISTLMDLAETGGLDISPCSNFELKLEDLPSKAAGAINKCVNNITITVDEYVGNGLRRLGTTLTNIASLESQMKSCGEISCLLSLVSEIDIKMIELPEQIDLQVKKSVDLIEEVTPQIDKCSTVTEEEYITEATVIYRSIIECVNKLSKIIQSASSVP